MGTVRIGGIVKSGPSTQFWLEADWIDPQDAANNRTLLRVWLRAANGPAGNSTSRMLSEGYQNAHANGYLFEYRANPFLPSGYAQNQQRWHVSADKWFGHDAAGYGPGVNLGMEIGYPGVNDRFDAQTAHTGWIGAPARIPKVPAAPTSQGVDSITTTSIRHLFSGNSDNGSAIIRWESQRATDPGFTQNVVTINHPTSGQQTHTELTPGTRYYFRARGVNGVGNGPWSSTADGTTLPAVAPGISVAPSLSGTSATVSLTPPGGVSGVTEYNIEYREGSAGAVTALTTTTTTRVINGLEPGVSYQYRANAEIGGYTSPWSNWLPATQPSPNTNAGDYYDGSFPAAGDVNYAWASTAHGSNTLARSVGVEGWILVSSYAIMHHATGGYADAKSARVLFYRDCTAAQQWVAGQDGGAGFRSQVTGNQVYSAAIWIRPTRGSRFVAQIAWFNSSGGSISTSTASLASVVAANTWGRVVISGVTAPANAAFAAVRVTDATGTGYSAQQGGDSILLDAAMIVLGAEIPTYFSGATPDTIAFRYDWTGAVHASTSTRTQLQDVVIDPLADPDCAPVPQPPSPPMIASDCIEEVGVWRRYGLQVSEGDVPRWGAALPTLILETGGLPERQVRIRFFPNEDGVAPDQLDTTEWEAELILSYIPPNSTLTLDGVTQRVWADVGGITRSADQLLYGTNGAPAVWPELTCGYGYLVTLDVPTDTPAGNLNTSMLMTQRV